ncbi:hypothetical protein BHE74_00039919 [Ensete ventricosum]|nr:hypothetical protein BHE74_00039919 [Ensete ventricosum]
MERGNMVAPSGKLVVGESYVAASWGIEDDGLDHPYQDLILMSEPEEGFTQLGSAHVRKIVHVSREEGECSRRRLSTAIGWRRSPSPRAIGHRGVWERLTWLWGADVALMTDVGPLFTLSIM